MGVTKVTFFTTHKVVIDADNEEHARWLVQALTNDGYRVRHETESIVQNHDGISIERKPCQP